MKLRSSDLTNSVGRGPVHIAMIDAKHEFPTYKIDVTISAICTQKLFTFIRIHARTLASTKCSLDTNAHRNLIMKVEIYTKWVGHFKRTSLLTLCIATNKPV